MQSSWLFPCLPEPPENKFQREAQNIRDPIVSLMNWNFLPQDSHDYMSFSPCHHHHIDNNVINLFIILIAPVNHRHPAQNRVPVDKLHDRVVRGRELLLLMVEMAAAGCRQEFIISSTRKHPVFRLSLHAIN